MSNSQRKSGIAAVAVCLVAAACLVGNAQAGIIVTNDTNPTNLGNALMLGGIKVNSVSLPTFQTLGTKTSTGTYSLSGPLPDTYGLLHGGIVLSTGNVADYATVPVPPLAGTTSLLYLKNTIAYDSLLDPVATPNGWGGIGYWDITKLDINFDLLPGHDTVYFDMVFGTEENFLQPGFYHDSFLAILNGKNMAIADGSPITAIHPDMKANGTVTNPGTQLAWVIAPNGQPVLHISAFVGDGAKNNTLSFLLADAAYADVDSTVYLSGLRGTAVVPEPSTLALAAMALVGFAVFRRRRAGRKA